MVVVPRHLEELEEGDSVVNLRQPAFSPLLLVVGSILGLLLLTSLAGVVVDPSLGDYLALTMLSLAVAFFPPSFVYSLQQRGYSRGVKAASKVVSAPVWLEAEVSAALEDLRMAHREGVGPEVTNGLLYGLYTACEASPDSEDQLDEEAREKLEALVRTVAVKAVRATQLELKVQTVKFEAEEAIIQEETARDREDSSQKLLSVLEGAEAVVDTVAVVEGPILRPAKDSSNTIA